jgi:hypothetical protein
MNKPIRTINERIESRQEPIRQIIRELEEYCMNYTPNFREQIISAAQMMAGQNGDERTIDILSIVKKRLVRKGLA